MARLVKSNAKTWHCLTRSGVRPRVPKDWYDDKIKGTKPVLGEILRVPCVGVYTDLDGDIIPDDKLHARIEWLCHLEAQQLIENAQTWPPNKLLAKPKYGSAGYVDLEARMSALAIRHREYNKAFELKWSDFPTHYKKDMADIIETRTKLYFDPVEVAKRDRVVSRREAKRALGVAD